MSVFIIALVAGMADQAPAADAADGIGIGRRLVAAIKTERDFQDADFVKPLSKGDKDALRILGNCKLERVMYRDKAYPKNVSGSVADPNTVRVVYACKGVPWGSPASLSLHLQGEKIASVETHNTDLIKVDR